VIVTVLFVHLARTRFLKASELGHHRGRIRPGQRCLI
jgi:hypothetical protein